MTVVQEPSEYVFASNPVVFELETTTSAMRSVSLEFGGVLFWLSVQPYKVSTTAFRITFDISDLLKQHIQFTYDSSQIYRVNVPNFVNVYDLTIPGEYTFSGKAIPGGLSNEFQQFLKNENTNAFDFRFLNPVANWLLTTRTDTNDLILSRKELACMFFLTPNDQSVSVLTDKGSKLELPLHNEQGVACMVNLPVWLESVSSVGVVNRLWFCLNDVKVIQVSIYDKYYEESYVLKFKNSLEIYEFLEVTAKAKRTPEIGEEITYNVFNSQLQVFDESRLRVPVTNVIETETGYKSMSDLYFIGELLSSTAAWFFNGINKQKCLVSSGNYSHALVQTEPESIEIKIKPVNSERYYSPITDINTIVNLLGTEEGDYIATDDNELISV